jgi:hypothetical protein
MRVFEIIIEGYKEAVTDFSQVADPQQVNTAINTYKVLVNKNQVSGLERNIDHWRKQGWAAFTTFVNNAAQSPTKTQLKRKKIVGKSINLVDDANWLVVIPLDKEASCFHGKDSDWCTTKTNQPQFEQYFYRNDVILIYCLNKQTGGMWAIAGHKDLSKVELFDQQDHTLTQEQFARQTGLSPMQLVQQAIGSHEGTLVASRKEYKTAAEYTKAQLPTVTARNLEIEKALIYMKDNYESSMYVSKLIEKGVDVSQLPIGIVTQAVTSQPRLLKSFSNVPDKLKLDIVTANGTSIQYIDNQTPKLIDAALKNEGRAVEFIKNIDYDTAIKYPKVAAYIAVKDKKLIPEAEATILTDPAAIRYYLIIRNGPWPEAEPEILKDPGMIVRYVQGNGNTPWPKGEDALLDLAEKDKDHIYTLIQYAKAVKQRWRDAEPLIEKDPESAADYAVKILRKRWPAIEDALFEIGPSADEGGTVVEYADRFQWEDYYEKYQSQIKQDELPDWFTGADQEYDRDDY